MADLQSHLDAPLAPFAGSPPPAPDWFTRAVAVPVERSRIMVQGAGIDVRAWGARGQPGVLLLHGNGAHADWWSFIAPWLADDYRVAALSWSGMGASDWRQHYSVDLFVAEAFAVMAATGLFEAPRKPVVVGHSFGGFPTIAAALRRGSELAGIVVVDTPIRSPEDEKAHRRGRSDEAPRPHRVYATIEQALARFRLAPRQRCENLFIADAIARASLREVDGGWSWRFDPYLWSRFDIDPTGPMLPYLQCPVAFIWGDRSSLMPAEVIGYMRANVSSDTPFIAVPDADHHVMIDQPLAFVAVLRALLGCWPRGSI